MSAGAPFRPVLPPDGGELIWLGRLGVRFMLGGERTGGRFALVEHPMRPRSLGAPMHTHQLEDEISFVLEGEVGVQLGETVFTARPGDLVVKPRGVPHTFWNAADAPARFLELITPAGFERFFAELDGLIRSGTMTDERFLALGARYRLGFDLASGPILEQRYGVSEY